MDATSPTQGSELGLAYGLVQAAGQAGSFFVFVSVPAILTAADEKLIVAYVMGMILAGVGVAALFLGRLIDKVRVKQLGDAAEEIKAAERAAEADARAGKALDSEEDGLLATGKSGDGSPSEAQQHEAELELLVASCGLCGRCLNSAPLRFLGFHHLLGLPLVFWCDLIAISVYNGSYFTFLGA